MRTRRALDALYDGAAVLAAIMMVGLLGMVVASILARQLHFHLPGTDAYSGYLMAGAGFLALAHTLKRNEHIRVTLLINAARGGARSALERWALFAGTMLAGLFAYYSVRLVLQSREFNDVSTGNDATPLWIPQVAMAVGAVILVVAFVDEFVLELRGRRSHAQPAEAVRNE